jgi:hypothetical protein
MGDQVDLQIAGRRDIPVIRVQRQLELRGNDN